MGLRSLSEFPIVKCPVVVGDNEYPALDWVRYAVKNMTARFTEVGVWLNQKIDFSRYTVIPICNLEDDSQSFVIDTLYARSLHQSKHLLWYSESSSPDLGGHEDRNYRIYFQDLIENPEIVKKGFYRTYSVEINITHLALNTILCYDQMQEYEEGA
jgi:DNA polymerase epsilon subunit 1